MENFNNMRDTSKNKFRENIKEINEDNFVQDLDSKGFLVVNFEKLLTWARTGSFLL